MEDWIRKAIGFRSSEGWLHVEESPEAISRQARELLSRLPLYSEGLEAFAKAELHLQQPVIRPFIPRDDTEGSPDHRLFFAADRADPHELVIQVYHQPLRLIKAVSALEHLKRLKLQKSSVPAVIALGRCQMHGKEVLLLAQQCMPGVTLARWMRTAGPSEIIKALTALASAVQELHSLGARPVKPAKGQWDRAVTRMGNWGLKVDRLCSLHMDMDPLRPQLMTAVLRLMEEAPRDLPESAYSHGDLHLGNVLYCPERGISLLDTECLHDSVDGQGRAQGIPAEDYVGLLERLSEIAPLLGQDPHPLQEAFKIAYGTAPDPVVQRFFRVQSRLFTLSEFLPLRHSGDDERRHRVGRLIEAKWARIWDDLLEEGY